MTRFAPRTSALVAVACVWLSSFAVACKDDERRPTRNAGAESDRDEDAGRSPDAPDNMGSEIDGGDATPSELAGTATLAECSSWQAPAEGRCAGYYCGVEEATLTSAIDPDAACGSDPAMSCSGELVGAVSNCARTVKGAMPLASDDTLRAMIGACVYDDSRFERVSMDCLGCFLDAAACAAEHCLVDCLSGDSATCDLCQLDNGCTRAVFECTGLPDPF